MGGETIRDKMRQDKWKYNKQEETRWKEIRRDEKRQDEIRQEVKDVLEETRRQRGKNKLDMRHDNGILIIEREQQSYLRFGPEDKDFSNHPEEVLSIRVRTGQPPRPLNDRKSQISRMIVLRVIHTKDDNYHNNHSFNNSSNSMRIGKSTPQLQSNNIVLIALRMIFFQIML